MRGISSLAALAGVAGWSCTIVNNNSSPDGGQDNHTTGMGGVASSAVGGSTAVGGRESTAGQPVAGGSAALAGSAGTVSSAGGMTGPRTVRVRAEVKDSSGKQHATVVEFGPFSIL